MKSNNLIRCIPFLSTIIIIFFLNIYNQKEITKLKILIWTTPSLTLGTYLTISTGAGFIFSYIVTTNLARIKDSKNKKVIRSEFNSENYESDEIKYQNKDILYDNTLIEREVKDPSPTIDAKFRVIGNTTRKNDFLADDNDQDEYYSSDFHDEFENSQFNYDNKISDNQISNDWNDESFVNW